MDLMSVIIGLVILALFALPFILSGNSRREMEKNLLFALQNQAKEHGTAITEHEFGSHFALALSADGAYAYFVREAKGSLELVSAPLQKVKLSRANTITRTVTNGKDKDSVIDRLELTILYKDAKEAEQKWVLFDIEELMQMSNEVSLMKSWETKINTAISQLKTPKPQLV